MHERPKKIWAAQYQGSTSVEFHSRSIMDVNDGLMEFTDGTNPIAFDCLMAFGIQKARLMGRKDFTLLDVGSGDGGIFTDFLSIPTLMKDTRAFLAQNPDFRVHLVGVTDSPSIDSHNTQKPTKSNEVGLSDQDKRVNAQIETRNMYWSITRMQSLADFLDANAIRDVDLALATESLKYLSARVFKDTVETVVDRLTIGGRFICQGFTGVEPGFSSRRYNYFKSTLYSEKHSAVWQKLLRISGTGTELEDEYLELTEQEMQQGLDRAIGVYLRLGLLSREEVEKDIMLVEANPLGNVIAPIDMIRSKAGLILLKGFNRLHARNRRQARIDKTRVLEDLDQSRVAIKPKCYIDKFQVTRLS